MRFLRVVVESSVFRIYIGTTKRISGNRHDRAIFL